MKKVIAIIIFFCFFCCRYTVFAHEMYYDFNGNGVELRWGNLQNGKPHLKINGDYLDSPYDSYLFNVVQAWPNASANVTATATSFNVSTVDMVTPTEEYWEERVGWLYINSIGGFTDNKDTNGLYIQSLADAQSSTGVIMYSQIYMSPYPDNFENSNHQEKTMVHELGHVLCLGHPDGDYYPLADGIPSIMRRGYHGYKVPQVHDYTDLANIY